MITAVKSVHQTIVSKTYMKTPIPIYWKYNARIKNLVPSERIVRGPTHLFPKSAVTVVLSEIRKQIPVIGIYIIDDPRPSRYTGTGAYSSTLRVFIRHEYPTVVSGSVDPAYLAELNEIIRQVKEVLNVL